MRCSSVQPRSSWEPRPVASATEVRGQVQAMVKVEKRRRWGRYDSHATSADLASGSLIQQVVPSGAVMAFNLDACPAGWSPLVAAAGRVVVGASEGVTRGSMLGSDTTTLTVDQLPGHVHAIADPGHQHESGERGFMTRQRTTRTDLGYAPGGNYAATDGCPNNVSGLGTRGATANATTGITGTNSTGGGQSFDNRQASLALLYCQKD